MTDREWTAISVVLEEGFKHPADRPWNERRKTVYRSLLDGYPADQVEAAIRKIIRTGVPFVPAVPEIVAAIQGDPGIPTWPEVEQHLFASPSQLRKLGDPHPTVAAFIRAQGGLDQIRRLPILDPARGPWELKRLREQYAEHVAVWKDRGDHAAAIGAPHGSPHRLNPISTIGLTAGELEAGEDAA